MAIPLSKWTHFRTCVHTKVKSRRDVFKVTNVNLLGYRRHYLHNLSIYKTTEGNMTSVPKWAEEASMYVHWPYCEKRCTYCNFNKYISERVDDERMKKCLLLETDTLLKRTHIKSIKSIFFGGGTPSLAPASTIKSVIDHVKQISALAHTAEITLEANPTSTEMEKLQAFKDGGINRISIGLQALCDKDLAILGRHHSVKEALRCLEEAKSIYPGRVSVDLIFGRPNQTLDSWQNELAQILQLCDNHISLYQLTLERGTQLYKQVQQGLLTVPSPEEMADMYECTVQTLTEAGYCRYEASNFSKQGSESSHNRSYWQGSQYVGVGPGAHGRYVLRESETVSAPLLKDNKPLRKLQPLSRWATTQTLEPVPWMTEVERYGHATRRAQPQSTTDMLEEILMLGLRTTEGVPEGRWLKMGGRNSLYDIFCSDPRVISLVEGGLVQISDSGVVATSRGLNVIDNITPYLLHILQDKMSDDDQHR